MPKFVLAAFATSMFTTATVALCLPQIPPRWSATGSSSPGARAAHAMAHDSARGRTVLFGGDTGWITPTLRSDTWEWDGTNWIPMIFATGPDARGHHTMAFHAATNRTVMFGGVGTTGGLADTWLWDGVHWSQAAVTQSPPGRRNGAMTYAPGLGGVFLFGGESFGPNVASLNDLWLFDGTNWSQVAQPQGPTARRSHTLTYDEARGRLVMYGGYEGSGTPTTELWEYDGTAWQLRPTAINPGPRYGHSMVYDSLHRVAVLYGGQINNTTNQYPTDTWLWNGTGWSQVVGPNPNIRRQAAMAYDTSRSRVTIMGGWGQQLFTYQVPWSDTFTWNSGYLSTVNTVGTGCGQSMDVAPGNSPVLGTTTSIVATTSPGIQASPWFIAFGWSRTSLGSFSLPLPLDGYGLPGCLLLQSSDVKAQMVQTSTTTATFGLSIPNWAGLAGLTLYCQSWAFSPGYNPGNTVVSNAVELGFGHS